MSHKSAKPKLSTFLQNNQEIKWHPSPSVHVSCHCHSFFFSKWGAVPRVVGISKQKHMRCYVFKKFQKHCAKEIKIKSLLTCKKNRRFNLAGATRRKPKWSPLVNLSMANTNHAARHIPPGAGHGITKCNGKKNVSCRHSPKQNRQVASPSPLSSKWNNAAPSCTLLWPSSAPALPCGEVSHPLKKWGTGGTLITCFWAQTGILMGTPNPALKIDMRPTSYRAGQPTSSLPKHRLSTVMVTSRNTIDKGWQIVHMHTREQRSYARRNDQANPRAQEHTKQCPCKEAGKQLRLHRDTQRIHTHRGPRIKTIAHTHRLANSSHAQTRTKIFIQRNKQTYTNKRTYSCKAIAETCAEKIAHRLTQLCTHRVTQAA